MTSTRNISLFFFTLNVDVMSFYQLVWKIITCQVINIIFDHFCQFEMIVFSRAVQLLTPERHLNALFHQVLWQLWNTYHVLYFHVKCSLWYQSASCACLPDSATLGEDRLNGEDARAHNFLSGEKLFLLYYSAQLDAVRRSLDHRGAYCATDVTKAIKDDARGSLSLNGAFLQTRWRDV